MKFEKDYYENIEIWTREPADYQRDILEEIQKIIPEDVKSILDAGCGNGVICNNLKDGYDITACDISETALSFVRTGKRFVASIDNLPFEDSSFDLVMVNDVLEHLDTERFMRAIDEIKRVSRKYIILSVPFMENLLFNYARCKKCGGEFHTNLHKRSFELKDFLNLFVGFSVRLSVFAGEIYQSTITPFVKYRHIFNEFISDTDTTCPFCGAENRKDIAKSRHFVERINDILEYSFLNRNYQLWKRRPDRLEILLLYVRDGIDFQPQKISVSGESSILSTNELHFSPTFLISELKPFYPYPQFSILRGRYNFEEDGLRLAGEDIGIRFSLPLNILPDSKIEIEIRVNSESELNIMAYDPVFDRYKLLGNLSLNSDSNNLNISISEAILPSRYGMLFEINIMGDVILKSLKVSGSNSEQNFEIINSNNGYLFKEIDGINFLYKTEKDRLIKPEWFFSLSKDFRLHSLFEEFDDRTYLKYLGELFLKFDDLFNRYQSELNQLQLLTERIERERARAEEVYQQALIEIERLNEMLEKKEIERDNAERVAVKYLEDIKSLEHRIGELNKKMEEIEHKRVIAEDAYSKTLKEIKDLNVLIEEKESKRLKAEEMYQRALNEIKLLQERERILNEAVERKEYERVEAEEIAQRYLRELNDLGEKVEELNKKMEEIEHKRVIAEDAYSKALKDIKDINEQLERKELDRAKAEEVASGYLADIKNLEMRFGELNDKLNKNEEEREKAERAYKDLLIEYNKLKDEYHSTTDELNNVRFKIDKLSGECEILRSENEDLRREMSEIIKEKEGLLKSFEILKSRKVRRVLVLSHMFPHKDQPVFGPFVLEQVKALLKYTDLDIRVISCRPFWMNTYNPVKLKEANRIYWEELRKIRWEERDGIKVLYPPYRVGGPFRFITHWHTYSQAVLSVIYDVWREFKFDIIHAHTAYIDGNAAKSIFEKLRIPYIITEHMGPYSEYVKNPIVLHKSIESSRFASRILCVSPYALEEVKRYMPEDVRNKMLVMPNTIDISEFYPSKIKKRHNNEYKLLFIGTLDEPKNPELLLRVLIRLLKAEYNLKLSIVGKGLLREKILNFISSNNIEGSVEVIDGLPHHQIPGLLRDKDILVLPSRSETFGVVVAEAIACGKPVVATKCGGPEYIINDDRLGRLVDVDDEDEFFDAIIDVINNYESFDPVCMHNSIKERFGFEHFAKRLREIYEEVVG